MVRHILKRSSDSGHEYMENSAYRHGATTATHTSENYRKTKRRSDDARHRWQWCVYRIYQRHRHQTALE